MLFTDSFSTLYQEGVIDSGDTPLSRRNKAFSWSRQMQGDAENRHLSICVLGITSLVVVMLKSLFPVVCMIAEAQSPLAAWGTVISSISSEGCAPSTRNWHKYADGNCNAKIIYNGTWMTGVLHVCIFRLWLQKPGYDWKVINWHLL